MSLNSTHWTFKPFSDMTGKLRRKCEPKGADMFHIFLFINPFVHISFVVSSMALLVHPEILASVILALCLYCVRNVLDAATRSLWTLRENLLLFSHESHRWLEKLWSPSLRHSPSGGCQITRSSVQLYRLCLSGSESHCRFCCSGIL